MPVSQLCHNPSPGSAVEKMEGYRRQTSDQKQLMLNMNLADDFFKAKRQADKLAAELEKKEREMYGIRHDLVEAQLLLEKRDTNSCCSSSAYALPAHFFALLAKASLQAGPLSSYPGGSR